MHKNAYSLWRVIGCQQGFRSVAKFGFGGQESASKPPQAICKPLVSINESMPLYLDLANLVFDKKHLDRKYAGGCDQFRIDWNMINSEVNQEDDELISLTTMNIDEFEIEKLINRGLEFDAELQFSNDFVAISRYGGEHWTTKWLASNGTFAWHVNCHPLQKERAVEIGEVMTMDKIQELFDKGINVFKTIKTDTNNT